MSGTSGQDTFDGDDPNWAIAAKQRIVPQPSASQPDSPAVTESPRPQQACDFVPREPTSFSEAGLREPQVEALALKFLLNTGGVSGREIAKQIALPFGVLEPLLMRLKSEQLIAYRGSTAIGDYFYELTPHGSERARSYNAQSTYFGSAPVPLKDYKAAVEAQSPRHHRPRLSDIKRTFESLVLSERVQRQLGEAINLGLGFFLHGPPGNGKTSIAERVTAVFGEGMWIPRAIQAGGEIIRVFDPSSHEVLEWNEHRDYSDDRVDSRWLYIKRPTIIVGGELRMESLEVVTNELTGISEAPMQLKANGGSLVIDDFGRQKFTIDELLNRLIIPLERRHDVLNLPSGRSFDVPFDQMIIFSTNLDPTKLVDEAFLRRIPLTIEAVDPTEKQFKDVFLQVAQARGLSCPPERIDYLLKKHFRESGRPLRFCHPRDILQQVYNSCDFAGLPLEVTEENLDQAVYNCLSIRSER